MYLIGLTGGIAAGKSVVASRFAEHGAVHIDADQLAREVVAPGSPALAEIATEFGASVLAADGSLDRYALGQLVFSDPTARAKLNAITHPAIQRRAKELFAAAAASDPGAVVVYDVPLLAETTDRAHNPYDLIVVVHADSDTRLSRLVELRGVSQQEARHRLNSQATDSERLAFADVVIDSNGSLEETIRQADELWERIATSAHSKHRP